MAAVEYHYGKFPPAALDLHRLLPLVGPANAALARYDGTLAGIPNASPLLAPLTTQEAVLSSRIEGTQATMGEVLEFEARHEVEGPKSAEITEVLNYRRAMNHALSMLKDLPLSQRVIREAHGSCSKAFVENRKTPAVHVPKINRYANPGGVMN